MPSNHSSCTTTQLVINFVLLQRQADAFLPNLPHSMSSPLLQALFFSRSKYLLSDFLCVRWIMEQTIMKPLLGAPRRTVIVLDLGVIITWVHRLVHLLVHLLELHLRLRVSTSFTESELNTFSLSARHPLFVSNRTISAISTIFRYRAPTMIIFTLHKNTAISSQTTYVFPSPIQLVIQNISLS